MAVRSVENAQSDFFKRFIFFRKRTSTKAVLGEEGRYSLRVKYFCRCITYWCRLVRLTPTLYPRAFYDMQKVCVGTRRKLGVTC